MSARVLAAAAVLLAAGCGQDSNTGLGISQPPDSEQLVKADEVAREYLRAAATGDAERMCAMRTQGALRELEGRAECQRKPRPLIGSRLSSSELARAEVLPGDTVGEGITATAMADYGRAVIESGHATGGKVLEVALRMEDGRYRVSWAGVAVFAD